jgi:hypothetical protein
MADDAQRIAGETRNDYPNARAAWALQEFNKRFGNFTFGAYFADAPLGFLGTPASGRNNVLGTRNYQGDSGFPAQFRDTLNPGEDQVHHVGAYFSAGLAGFKIIPDLHRADDRASGNMGDVRLADQSRRLGDYLRRNPVAVAFYQDAEDLQAADKAHARRAREGAIKLALATITESDARDWFRHCGYALTDTETAPCVKERL